MLRRVLSTIIVSLIGSLCVPLHANEALDKEIRNYNVSIQDAIAKHDHKRLGQVLAARTILFYNNALTDSITYHAPKDLEMLRDVKEWDRYYETWTYLINTLIYYSKSKNIALREVQSMYADAKERNNEKGLGIAYYMMGNVYLNMNNLDESASSYRKGLDILLKQSPLPAVVQEIYSYLGDVLNEQQRYDELNRLTAGWKEFLDHFLAENINFDKAQTEILWFLYDIACVQAATGLEDFPKAQKMLDEAYNYVHSEDDYLASAWYTAAAELRLRQHRYMEAMYLNTRRMGLVTPDEDKAVWLSVAKQRGEILTGLHRYEESSQLYRDMYFLKDSLNSADTKSQLTEMNTLFHVDDLKMQQERELFELNMQQERTRFRLLMTIVGIIVLALVIFIVFRVRAARRLKKAHDELQHTHDKLLTAYDQLEETTAAKERIESDLRIARNIQMGMVPSSFPERPDLDLYASMTPAKEVGGDLYGYYLTGDKLYIALGDVSGKGVPASLFMAQATRLFRTLAAQKMMPAEIATRINDALSGEDNETGMFVTMFLGLIDLQTGALHFCNAGHNPPVLMHDGKTEFIEMVPNAPIGIFPELEFEGEEIADISNSVLFVYTDGLNEAENRQQEQFTDERLLEIMETTPFVSCRQTVEMLKEEVERHRDGAEPNDDLTMLCVKVIREDQTNN